MSSQMSEKLVFHILKFVGGEIEKTRHIGYYAQWGHSLMMHHGLWIKRRWREFLPLLNQLQKGLSTKSSDLSEVCDRNAQTVDFLIKLASVKKEKKIAEKEVADSSDDESEEDMDFDNSQTEGMAELQSKWSDDDE